MLKNRRHIEQGNRASSPPRNNHRTNGTPNLGKTENRQLKLAFLSFAIFIVSTFWFSQRERRDDLLELGLVPPVDDKPRSSYYAEGSNGDDARITWVNKDNFRSDTTMEDSGDNMEGGRKKNFVWTENRNDGFRKRRNIFDETIFKNTAKKQRKLPRVIAIEYSPQGPLSVIILPQVFEAASYNISSLSEPAMPRLIDDDGLAPPDSSWYLPNALDHIDGYDLEQCEHMYDWQLQSFPDCNKFHEMNWFGLKMINSGGSRTAFQLKQYLPHHSPQKFVYKTTKYHKEIDDHYIEQQRKDSLVMERTSGSKFIPNIWGYCGLAVMMDFMPEGNMHDYIKGSRIAGGSRLAPVDKLRIAIHIASSVADLHTIDGTKYPSIFHNDICCHQFLFQDGIFKLNDFNYARPIYVNKVTKEQCTRERSGMAMWKSRSLEEHMLRLGHPDFKPFKPDKGDVWMMGNVIYIILTDLYTFEKPKNLSWKESGQKLLNGERSPYPKYIAESDDPSVVAIKQALDMCWTQNWRERPPAREVSDFLMNRLRKITGEDDPDLRVTLPERDPDQKPTDHEFERFND
mmetsp:Transcript_14398/g.29520  ORF Transcript_14398/g.29520 Transcript_14398/m.29520 type:complete len:571 (+) Transcript_14398:215-1927(+)